MRKCIIIALLLTAVVAITACTAQDTAPAPAPAPGQQGQGQAADTPAAPGGEANDTLIWVQNADITSLDPHVGREAWAITVTANIFDSLLEMVEGTPVPSLAESWEQLDDLTWQFNIRQGVYFHDGVPLTAEDVKFAIERSRDSPQVQFVSGFVSHVDIVDDFTVNITTNFPFAPILSNLSTPFMAIVPKHLLDTPEGLEHFLQYPVGTGAYRFVEWRRGDSALLEANPDYFRGPPRTRFLQMRVVPEASQRTIAIETGEAHLALDVASTDAHRIMSHPDLTFHPGDTVSIWHISMNMNRPPLDDVRVRQAIRYAINQDDIIFAVRDGMGEISNSLIPPAAFGHSTHSRVFDHNLERARELMEEAGVGNVNLTLYVNDATERVQVCEIVQAQLLQIGINVDIRILEFATFLEATAAGNHDLAFLAWTIVTLDADYNYFSMTHSSQQGGPGNRAFIDCPEVDRIVEEARRNTDPAVRQALYDELAVRLSEIVGNAYIMFVGSNAGSTARLQGFVKDPNNYHRLRTAYLID